MVVGCSNTEKVKTDKSTIQDKKIIKVQEETMKLTSTAFENGEGIPVKYTCDGENISPPLKISDVPKESKTLVLIMDDPDAVKPANKVWDHWIVFDIPPETIIIPENTEPKGVHGIGTGENLEYVGSCPPDKEHRYFFKLYALDTTLKLKEGSTKKQVEDSMKEHILAEAVLIGTYKRL